MKTLKILFFVLIAALLLTTSANAHTDFYVNGSTGNDDNDGSSGSPWATISYAVANATGCTSNTDRCVIHVAAGSYGDMIEFSSSKYENITIISDSGASQTTIDTSSDSDLNPIRITVDSETVSNITISGFTLKPESSVASLDSNGVETGVTNFLFENNIFEIYTQSAVIMKVAWTATYQNNIFHGIDADNNGGAFQNWNTGHDIDITNNTFYNTSCFQTGDGNTMDVTNNIFYNSSINLQEESDTGEDITLSCNCFYNTTPASQITNSNPTNAAAAFKSTDLDSADYMDQEDYSACAIAAEGGSAAGAVEFTGTHRAIINVPDDVSTVNAAIPFAAAGYIINIDPGDYTLSEMINIQVANLKLLGGGRGDVGDEEATTTLTADFNGGVIQVSDGASGAIIGDDPSTELVTGLRINAQSTEDGPAVIMVQDDATIQNCFIFGSTNEDVFKGVEVNSQGDAVTALIHNNIIVQAGRSVFLNGQQGLTNATITNNTMYGGYLGFQIDTSGTVIFKNNIVANHAQAGVTGWDGPTVTATYTNSYNNNDQDWPNDETEEATGNISEDPLFYAAASNDFRIIEEVSPCYETGESSANMGALLTPVAQFSPVYADASAQAGGDGSSAESALTSITTCLNLTSFVCNVAAGTYNEDITMRSDVTLAGAGASSTTIQGSGNANVVTFSSISNSILSGLTISGTSDGLNNIYVSSSENITILDNIISSYSTTETSGGFFATELGELIYNENEYVDVCGDGGCGEGFMLLVGGEDPVNVFSSETAISEIEGESNLLLCLCSVTHSGLGDIFTPVFLNADDFSIFNNEDCAGDLGGGVTPLANLLFEGEGFSNQQSFGFGAVLLAQGEGDYAWQDSSFDDRTFDAESITPEISYVSGGGYEYAGIYLDDATNFKMQRNSAISEGTDINLVSGSFHSDSCGNIDFSSTVGSIPDFLDDDCVSGAPPPADEDDEADLLDDLEDLLAAASVDTDDVTALTAALPAAAPALPTSSDTAATDEPATASNEDGCGFTIKATNNGRKSSFGMLMLIVLIGLAALRRKPH